MTCFVARVSCFVKRVPEWVLLAILFLDSLALAGSMGYILGRDAHLVDEPFMILSAPDDTYDLGPRIKIMPPPNEVTL